MARGGGKSFRKPRSNNGPGSMVDCKAHKKARGRTLVFVYFDETRLIPDALGVGGVGITGRERELAGH